MHPLFFAQNKPSNLEKYYGIEILVEPFAKNLRLENTYQGSIMVTFSLKTKFEVNFYSDNGSIVKTTPNLTMNPLYLPSGSVSLSPGEISSSLSSGFIIRDSVTTKEKVNKVIIKATSASIQFTSNVGIPKLTVASPVNLNGWTLHEAATQVSSNMFPIEGRASGSYTVTLVRGLNKRVINQNATGGNFKFIIF